MHRNGSVNNLYGEGKRKKIVFDRRLLIIMIDIVIVVFAFIGISAYQRSLSRVGDFGGAAVRNECH